jgi:hypothetical protein
MLLELASEVGLLAIAQAGGRFLDGGIMPEPPRLFTSLSNTLTICAKLQQHPEQRCRRQFE